MGFYEEVKIAPKAWEDGLSNDIIIFGKRYPLTKERGKGKMVRNFLDDPSLDVFKVGRVKNPELQARPRKGNPKTMDALKKTIQYAVLHFDMTSYARKTLGILVGRGLSTHFVINWNGVIYQLADVAIKTSHAGKGKNDVSIGVDLNHLGPRYGRDQDRERLKRFKDLEKAYAQLAKEKLRERGVPANRLNELVDEYRFEKARTMRLNGGAPLMAPGYTPKQYEALILLFKLFVRELDLEKNYPMTPDGKVLPHFVEGEDLKKLKGFVGHWHLSDSRWDPGPGFDWERVLAALQHEHNSFPLMWEKHHVISSQRDIDKVYRAGLELMRNNERERRGGTYPIGPNQTWHGGIHLFPPKQPGGQKKKRYPVFAMFDGVVVAAHFEDGRRDLGHNNFVLLRHTIEIPKRNGKLNDDGTPETTDLQFYSLYMHLDSMNVSMDGAQKLATRGRVEWVQRLYDLDEVKKDRAQRRKKQAEFERAVAKKRKRLQEQLDRGEAIDAELEVLLELSDEDLVENLTKTASPYLSKGDGTKGLNNSSQVAVLVSDELQCKVSAGEVLGYVGLLKDDRGELCPTLHVEVFGNESCFQKIDLDKHAEHFRTPQRSRSADLTVRTEDILSYFRDASRYRLYKMQFWPERRIQPDDIKNFFGREGSGNDDVDARHREQLRRSITYHVSEWSDQVDWIASLMGGNDWVKAIKDSDFKDLVGAKGMFSNEIKKFLPFIWLNKDVAEGIGLVEDKWDGRVYHFHPIHFLLWVSYYAARRNRVIRTRLSLASLRKRQRRRKAIDKLVKAGKTAHRKRSTDKRAWAKFLKKLNRGLEGSPFRLSAKKRQKSKEKLVEYQELYSEIIDRVVGDFHEEETAGTHGLVENYSPAYSNPKEVLEDLYELPSDFEWRVRDNESG